MTELVVDVLDVDRHRAQALRLTPLGESGGGVEERGGGEDDVFATMARVLELPLASVLRSVEECVRYPCPWSTALQGPAAATVERARVNDAGKRASARVSRET